MQGEKMQYPNMGNMGNQGNMGNMGSMAFYLAQQQVKKHVIRNHNSWKSIIQQTADWVNTKSHVIRVISISVILAHGSNEGLTVIYYDDSQSG